MYVRTPRDLGLLIRERRRKLGLRQEQLARRVGVSRQWILKVEKGKPRVDAGLLLKTLTALGLALDVRDAHVRDAPRTVAHPVDIDAVVAAARRRAQ
jgi:HTH-type transcriptional regulator/antitoxin HipB